MQIDDANRVLWDYDQGSGPVTGRFGFLCPRFNLSCPLVVDPSVDPVRSLHDAFSSPTFARIPRALLLNKLKAHVVSSPLLSCRLLSFPLLSCRLLPFPLLSHAVLSSSLTISSLLLLYRLHCSVG